MGGMFWDSADRGSGSPSPGMDRERVETWVRAHMAQEAVLASQTMRKAVHDGPEKSADDQPTRSPQLSYHTGSDSSQMQVDVTMVTPFRSEDGSHTLYALTCKKGDKQWRIFERYSSIRRVYEMAKVSYPFVAGTRGGSDGSGRHVPFPGKKWLKNSKSALERAESLLLWLSTFSYVPVVSDFLTGDRRMSAGAIDVRTVASDSFESHRSTHSHSEASTVGHQPSAAHDDIVLKGDARCPSCVGDEDKAGSPAHLPSPLSCAPQTAAGSEASVVGGGSFANGTDSHNSSGHSSSCLGHSRTNSSSSGNSRMSGASSCAAASGGKVRRSRVSFVTFVPSPVKEMSPCSASPASLGDHVQGVMQACAGQGGAVQGCGGSKSPHSWSSVRSLGSVRGSARVSEAATEEEGKGAGDGGERERVGKEVDEEVDEEVDAVRGCGVACVHEGACEVQGGGEGAEEGIGEDAIGLDGLVYGSSVGSSAEGEEEGAGGRDGDGGRFGDGGGVKGQGKTETGEAEETEKGRREGRERGRRERERTARIIATDLDCLLRHAHVRDKNGVVNGQPSHGADMHDFNGTHAPARPLHGANGTHTPAPRSSAALEHGDAPPTNSSSAQTPNRTRTPNPNPYVPGGLCSGPGFGCRVSSGVGSGSVPPSEYRHRGRSGEAQVAEPGAGAGRGGGGAGAGRGGGERRALSLGLSRSPMGCDGDSRSQQDRPQKWSCARDSQRVFKQVGVLEG
jgi:hypothetical protein